MSLIRDIKIDSKTKKPAKKQSLHTMGRAVDISHYSGIQFHVNSEDKLLDGLINLIQDLPPGFYALGLPRLPRSITIGKDQDKDNPKEDCDRYQESYKFYKVAPDQKCPNEPELEERVKTLNNPLEFVLGTVKNQPAPLERLSSPNARNRLKASFDEAKQHSVNIVSIFPDAPDHVHLSVASSAEEFSKGL